MIRWIRCAFCLLAYVTATVVSFSFASAAEPPEAANKTDWKIPDRIVVATRQVPPFSMLNDEGQWEGISIALLREIKAELEIRSNHEIELEFRELPLAEMLDAVQDGDVDIAAAAITVNFEREKRMDFTHAFYSVGLAIAVGAKQRRSGWSGIIDAILSATFLRIVGWLLAAMFLSAIAMYLFERRQNSEHFSRDWINGIAAGMWWAAVTLTTVGYGDKVPRSVAGRILALVWMFAGLFIIASFTAAVTSALTVTQLRTRINGVADLSRFKVGTVQSSTSADFLGLRDIPILKYYPTVEAALESLRLGNRDAIVYDEPILRYLIARQLSDEAYVIPISGEQQNYAFALPSDSPLQEPVNQSLLRQISSPGWQDIVTGYLGH